MERDLNRVVDVIRSCITIDQLLIAHEMVILANRKYPEKEVELFFTENLNYQFNKIVYGYRNKDIN